MEKIQAAIAKARAARLEPEPGFPAEPKKFPARPLQTKDVAKETLPEITKAWEALQSFSPTDAQMNRAHVVTYEGGAEAMAFDALRTKLLQQMRTNAWRRVALTSPGAACGKSTLALNLAFSMARQSNLRTILAELDLRRPSLARMAGLKGHHNFGNVLSGEAEFSQNAMRYGSNLALATNHSNRRHAAELLASPKTEAALAKIEADYAPDVMIFDTQPMLVCDDMMAFAAQVDCVLLVAAAEQTTIKEIDACERELASQTNVVGVVLNKCRYMDRGEGYGYDY